MAPDPPRWLLGTFVGIQATAILVAVVAGAVVVAGGPTAGVSCPRFPGCLADPSGRLALVHTGAAGLLLGLVGAGVGLAFLLRRTAPALLPWAAAAFLVLGLMAGLGAALATGAVPLSWAPLQIAVLALLVLLLAIGAIRARSVVRGLPGPPGERTLSGA